MFCRAAKFLEIDSESLMKYILKRIADFIAPNTFKICSVADSAKQLVVSVDNALNAWTMPSALKRLSTQGFTFSTILDIGASDGKWTQDALTVFPDAQYLLFEPLEERRGDLNLLKERFDNVDFILAAVGSEAGEVSLVVTDDLDGSRALLDHEKSAATRNVPLVTIDDALAVKKLNQPYLLKLDVHGYELPILAGAAATLNQTRVVIVEAYNFHITAASPTFSELVAYMDKAGFYCIDIVDPLRMTAEGYEWQVDLFFARKDDPVFAGKTVRF